MDFVLLKYTIIILNLLLFSQAQLETNSKLQVLACSKLLNQKLQEKPQSEILTKMLLSCFVQISQSQAQKIFYSEESESLPLTQEEIEELIDIKNLEKISKEELKSKSALFEKYIQEIESPKDNIRKLVELDNNATEGDKDIKDPINNEDIKNSDDLNDIDNNDMDDGMYDGMGDYNDTNYYGDDDMNYEGGMYDDDYYDDYYDDDYWKNGNYDYGNMSDEDYTKMYGNDYSNDYGYNYNENQTYKEWIMENKFAAIFIVCLVIMVILIAIFGKDYEETQTLEIDPNKNKNE